MHFGKKLCIDQRNEQVFNLLIYLLLPYMFITGSDSSFLDMVGALTPYPGDLLYCRNCIPASEDGLKESPKHVRQKQIGK
jgi:hypothetical protein